MSVSNDFTNTDDDVEDEVFLSTFLEFSAKVRNSDPSILPEPGEPFRIDYLSEKENTELADALLENNNVAYLELEAERYTKISGEAMVKYVRTSKFLQRLRLWTGGGRDREEMVCWLLDAIQESTSIKELRIELPPIGGPSNLAFENMLAHTQSLKSLRLRITSGRLENLAVAAARSGLKKNTTLRELTLDVYQGATIVSSLFTSLSDHPSLQSLCLRLRMQGIDLTGLETVLLSDNAKITELDIHRIYRDGLPITSLTNALRALGHRLTKLGLRCCPLGRDDARLLRMALYNMSSLQSLVLTDRTLRRTGLAELAPALYRNTSIKVLDISENVLNDMASAELLRDIIRRNETLTTLNLSWNGSWQTTGAVECIADGLGSNSTLLKIDLSSCALGDNGLSTLARSLGSRNTTLQQLTLKYNYITSAGVGVLLQAMEQNSCHITDLDLQRNPIENEGATLLARALGEDTLPNLTHLSLSECDIGDDGFIALVLALEQNTSLRHLDLGHNHGLMEWAFLALAESLPDIKVLQRIDLQWCRGLRTAMPLLLEGLRKNTSLSCFHVGGCAPSMVPPSTADTARCASGWMQEMERLGYRNHFLPLIRAPKERLPPRGIWPHALARVAILPDVIFEVLRSKPSLVPSEETEGKEATRDTGIPTKRKRGDE
jgi:Ran GTPase-activating protein (RanGAP) involved in mRNA processing and transport